MATLLIKRINTNGQIDQLLTLKTDHAKYELLSDGDDSSIRSEIVAFLPDGKDYTFFMKGAELTNKAASAIQEMYNNENAKIYIELTHDDRSSWWIKSISF